MSVQTDADLLGDQILDVMRGLTEEERRERRRMKEDEATKNAALFLFRATEPITIGAYPSCHHREWSFEIESVGVRIMVKVKPEGT